MRHIEIFKRDETGLWDAMVCTTEIRATELCYVLHGTLGCFLMHSDNLQPSNHH